MKAAAEVAQEHVNRYDHQRGVPGRWKPGSQVADSENTIGDDCLPVIQNWFFEPGFTAESRCDPIVTGQHFAGNLSVAGLVGADQSEVRESEEKEEAAKSGEQQNIGREARWDSSFGVGLLIPASKFVASNFSLVHKG